MRTPVPDYLEQVLTECHGDEGGERADYIPELAQAPLDRLAVALCTPDGTLYSAGDADVEFTIQSASKPFVYALALEERGWKDVYSHVGTEPSGDAFNEISLEPESGRPRNPMINIGAITTHSLVGSPELDADERFEHVRAGLSAFAGRELAVDEAVFASEMETADRNRSLAYMVRTTGALIGDPLDQVEGYTRQCSIAVTTADLAMMGATLANAGVNPISGKRVVSPLVVRQVLSVMTTCGMYDAAGDWISAVGIPAKSGVSGCILGVLPGQVGIGTFSPALDSVGNSVRGVQICQRLSDDMGLHLMGAVPSGQHTVRDIGPLTLDGREATRVQLQGVVRFSEAERVMRALTELPEGPDPVVLDLSRVAQVDQVGRRMLLEGVRRLHLDGHDIAIVDPEDALPDPDEGYRPTRLSLGEL